MSSLPLECPANAAQLPVLPRGGPSRTATRRRACPSLERTSPQRARGRGSSPAAHGPAGPAATKSHPPLPTEGNRLHPQRRCSDGPAGIFPSPERQASPRLTIRPAVGPAGSVDLLRPGQGPVHDLPPGRLEDSPRGPRLRLSRIFRPRAIILPSASIRRASSLRQASNFRLLLQKLKFIPLLISPERLRSPPGPFGVWCYPRRQSPPVCRPFSSAAEGQFWSYTPS